MRRILLSILVLFAICAGFSGAANATTCTSQSGAGDDCYWTGAVNSAWATSGNWSDSPGSGGTPGASCACTPASGANIHIGPSASNSNVNLNMAATRTFGDWDGGSYTGALTWGSTTQTSNKVGAVLTFGPSQTFPGTDNTSILAITGTGTQTLDPGGASGFPGIIVNGAGGTVQLTGHSLLSGPSNLLSLTNGTFNANGQNATIGSFACTNNANTKAFTLSTGTLTLTNNNGGAIFDSRPQSGSCTISAASGTINWAPTATGANANLQAYLANYTIGTCQFNTAGTSPFSLNINNVAATCTNLAVGGYTTFIFNVGWTVTNATTLTASAAKPISFQGGGAARTLTFTGGLTCTYCYASWITKSGGTVNFNNSFDGGSNTGITFTPPSGGNSLIGL